MHPTPAASLACALLFSWALPAPAHADVTVRASLTDADAQGMGASGTGPVHAVAISGDGTLVAFVALATNLVPGDTNGVGDVFVRDLVAGSTERVSVSTGGAQGDEISYLPAFSSNGRYVAFTSYSSTLVAGDTNGWADVFVRDLATDTTRRESVSTGGVQGNLNSQSPSLSADGEWLVFWSNASTHVAGDTNGTGDIFLRNTVAGITRRINLSVGGAQANANSGAPSISAQASTVAYTSDATNLDGVDTNGKQDIFLYQPSTGTVGRVDRGPGNPEPDGDSFRPTLSGDGRYVAFSSEATNWIFGDTNGVEDVFVHDRELNTFERVSVATGGGEGNGRSWNARISENGVHVVFESEATNLVPGDTNGWQDVFSHNLLSGETRRVSRSSAGVQGDSLSFYAAPSSDGSVVAFGSHAANLVAGDTNFQPDVFVRRPELAPVAYCFGSVAACPCGNAALENSGCGNSLHLVGARLAWFGSTNAVADDLVLRAFRLIPNQPALAFVGLDPISGVTFGDGLRCVGTGVVRLGVQSPNAAGEATYGPGLSAIGGWLPGDRRYFQVWYRDPQGPCGSGFNLTNGLRVDFGS